MRLNLAVLVFALCGGILPVLAGIPGIGPDPACQTVTQVVTTTVTVSTVPIVCISQVVANPTLTASSPPLSTLTSYSTLTNYVTVFQDTTLVSSGDVAVTVPSAPISVIVSPSTSSTSSIYYYVDTSGTTSWLGDAPARTYKSFLTETVEVTVYPTSALSQDKITVYSTEIFTLPQASSPPIASSMVSPDATSQLQAPTTAAVVTSRLTEYFTSVSTVTITTSFSGTEVPLPGLRSYGWNASTTRSGSTVVGPHMTRGPASGPQQGPITITKSVQYAHPTTFSTSSSAAINVASAGSTQPYRTSISSVDSRINATISFATDSSAIMATYSSSSGLYAAVSMLGTGLLSGYSSKPVPSTQESAKSTLSPTDKPFPITPTASTSVLSSSLTKVYTNTTSSVAAATPSVCGEYGNFTLTWDDEPTFSPLNPITDPLNAPPVFNPYHHLFFSNGFVYIPPPTDPFPPISPPRLIMFLTNDTGPTSSTDAGLEQSGEIGTGDRASSSAFWFNTYSAYLGCDNEGPDPCIMQISGFVWQASSNTEISAYQQNVTIPACPGLVDCRLRQTSFSSAMTGLSGIRIQALVGDEKRAWYMDNLAMGWYNNTCSAGLLRQMSR
ncbi:hypothetical protein MBLNU459_g7933t1 [Dothideomycetes sp. NU459]